MRLPAAETQTRIAWLKELYGREPSLTIRATQVRLMVEFGRTMRPATLLKLRKEVLTAAKPAGKIRHPKSSTPGAA